MYKDVLRTISDIEVFPMISLMIFTVVFAAVLIWVFTMDRETATYAASLPLDDTERQPKSGE